MPGNHLKFLASLLCWAELAVTVCTGLGIPDVTVFCSVFIKMCPRSVNLTM